MTDDEINRARAERDTIGKVPSAEELKPSTERRKHTAAPNDAKHAAYQRLATARNNLTAALRAFDDGQGGEHTLAPLEMALDDLRAAARACRGPR